MRQGQGYAQQPGNNVTFLFIFQGFPNNSNPGYSLKTDDGSSQNQKKVPNPANFKIVKCKNFEKEGQCKYGNTCTFAHGEGELRTKTENSMLTQGNFGMNSSNQVLPSNYNPYMVDPNLLFYMQNQMGMNYGMNMPNMGKILF